MTDLERDYIAAPDLPSKLPDPESITGLVAFDTETSALHPDPPENARVSVVSLAWADDEGNIHAGAYPFGQGPDPENSVDLGAHEWNRLICWMRKAGGGLVGHNAKFDVLMMKAGTVTGRQGVELLDRLVWDTMVVAREIWPQTSAALKSLGALMFGADADAEQQALQPYLGPKKDPRYDLVPWDVMKPYAIQDAVLTLKLLHKQVGLIDEGIEGTRHFALELDICRALTRMEFAGIPYDPELSLEQAAVLNKRIVEIGEALPFKPTLPKAKVYFFGTEEGCLGIKPSRLTDTGAPALDAEVVAKLVLDEVPHAAEYQEIQRYKSAVSKWYTPFAERTGLDGRLRTSFRQVASGSGDVGGTKSGRFSSGRVNLQAVPKDYKIHLPVLTPRQIIGQAVDRIEGWSLWDLDLAQAELRTAALDADCKPMLELIRGGEDTHGTTATQLFGTEPDHPAFEVNRQIAKRANFSLIFGSGVKTFRDMIRKEAGVNLTETRASEIVYGWRDLYPEFGERIQYCMNRVDQQGYIELTNGKRRYYASFEESHSAFNQRIQGSLAEYAKAWLLQTERRMEPIARRGLEQGIGRAGLVLVVHDSQVLLLPEDQGERLVGQVQEAGVRLWDEWFPGVPGGIDVKRWGE